MSNPFNPASFVHPLPSPNLASRRAIARQIRRRAAQISRRDVVTSANEECIDFAGTWPTNFSKGLPHYPNGLVEPHAMQCFVNAINGPDTDFDVPLGPCQAQGAHRPSPAVYSEDPAAVEAFSNPANPADKPAVRGWESPISGHVYDLEGPDAGSVGMAPAPKLGSDELAAEMAEVYAMAILRDVPFTDIGSGDPVADSVISALNAMPWFQEGAPVADAGGGAISKFSEERRKARFQGTTALSRQTLFRGSTPGAQEGPYISQFMLQGNRDIQGSQTPEDGEIVFGAQRVDQRVETAEIGTDYMTDWSEWLDVQNGANLKGTDRFEPGTRFVSTPRDLATYVHFDALYQAYLNACLLLLANGAPTDRGLPEKNGTGTRDAFATFGGPHILTLVTETATRSLKAVRRQKYNFHLRARPEAMGSVATLAAIGDSAAFGNAQTQADAHLAKLQGAEAGGFSIIGEIAARNGATGGGDFPTVPDGSNYLLPMAFPEGSPMHPAYGAGHATVAGSCTTMLKAFFEMFRNTATRERLTLADVGMGVYQPTDDGQTLINAGGGNDLTVEGELDKLAANISIGRNMAGVHYYSDYYDSLRMGERIAVGMLMEQMLTYGEPMSLSLTSFDGDALTVRHTGTPSGTPGLVVNGDASAAARNEWFERHVV